MPSIGDRHSGSTYCAAFFLTGARGTDLVLGMDWWESLGDVKANFKNLSLRWGKGGQKKGSRRSFTMQNSSLLEDYDESSPK